MPDLAIYISNRMEILAAELAQVMRGQPCPPLSSEVIVVQSRGMERWLSMELARINGICANCDFPFPNALLEDIFRKMRPDLPDTSPYDPGVLTWRIMDVLPGCLRKPAFSSLREYLADDRFQLKLYQLAARIADLFDQYLVFRPEMVFRWETGTKDSGAPEDWQAELWREATRKLGGMHRARLRNDLITAIQNGRFDTGRLPARISIFGLSYLPLFHLEIFAALSRRVPILLFLLNPCREYWADIVSERELQKARRQNPRVAENPAWYHFEKGNRLLASMGTLGRSFFEVVSALECEIHERFEAPPRSSLLGRIQSNIFHLTDGRSLPKDLSAGSAAQNQFQPESIPAGESALGADPSVQVHSCHSPMREIEVLHDNLLAMFEEDPQLLPRDIIVMTPDIDAYAPFVQAVFEGQTDDARRIPFSIADRSPRQQNRMIDGFLALLELRSSRFEAARVFALLEFPGIRQRFELLESDLPLIEVWIRDTRIRWGIDEHSRAQIGLPAFSQNTWKAGLQRLLLGYAMAGDNRKLFGGIVPYDNLEGAETRVLGRFCEFINRLFEWINRLETPRSLEAWRQTLLALMENFFKPDDDLEAEMQLLRRCLDELADKQLQADFQQKVEPGVVTAFLKSRLDQNNYGSRFLTGGVTFCALLPMRSIPFKIICLVGMNNDAFPRDHQPLNFDLMARHPRPGDRSQRNDDKYLFLESILSARQKLYISYVGQSIQDNTAIPPSVLVSELLDTIVDHAGICAEAMTTRHRLQHFSPWYFREDSCLFSYSTSVMAALAGIGEKKDPPPFVTDPLPMNAEENAAWQHLDIETLCRFFSNPARFFLQQRLGIRLEDTAGRIEESETFVLDPLEKHMVAQELLEKRLCGTSPQIIRAIQRGLGLLPQGSIGDCQYREMDIAVENFVNRYQRFTGGGHSSDMQIEGFEISGIRLKGRLAGIFDRGRIDARYGKRRGQDLMTAWIRHLLYSCQGTPDRSRRSFLLCTDRVTEFEPVGDSEKILGEIIGLFRQGLEQPLHFFPRAAFEYAEQVLQRSATPQTALASARNIWTGGDFAKYSHPESKDPYYDLCFRRSDPLDEVFEKTAITIFKPILRHCREIVV